LSREAVIGLATGEQEALARRKKTPVALVREVNRSF
jgi:hypothetical protein